MDSSPIGPPDVPTWSPYPDLHLRVTRVGDGRYVIEALQRGEGERASSWGIATIGFPAGGGPRAARSSEAEANWAAVGKHADAAAVAALWADQDQADAAEAAQWLSLERERLTVELADAIAERDKARVDVAEYQALFDMQWTRMGEATALWRDEAPEERDLVMPDLGDLLAWLMARGPARIPAGDVESRCRRCGGVNVPWTAPSPLWNMVMRGGSINGAESCDDGIVCLACFAELAEERHIGDLWRLDATRVNVELETVTPSGRRWDSDTWMWVDPPGAVGGQP